jgi:hypothetical protein
MTCSAGISNGKPIALQDSGGVPLLAPGDFALIQPASISAINSWTLSGTYSGVKLIPQFAINPAAFGTLLDGVLNVGQGPDANWQFQPNVNVQGGATITGVFVPSVGAYSGTFAPSNNNTYKLFLPYVPGVYAFRLYLLSIASGEILVQ